MTDYEIYSLQSYTNGIEEDLRPIKRAEFEDLNQEKIKQYIEEIKNKKPNLSKFSNEKILKLNGIIENSTGEVHPTLAGMMVFGEYPQGYLPQLFIACVVVPGRKLGDVGELGQRFDDNGKRTDVPHYPMKALREAIANALIHRDYSTNTDGAYIYLRIFDNRIEILNPGGLYGNNRLENLGSDNILEVRNNTIIRLLEDTTDIVENRHTGIATMREEMKKLNLPEPEFENLRGTFKVTFRKEKEESNVQNRTEQIQSGQKWTEVDRNEIIKNMESTQDKILYLIKENPRITQTMMSNELGFARSTISSNLQKLKEKGIIDRIGSDRNGYWKILK